MRKWRLGVDEVVGLVLRFGEYLFGESLPAGAPFKATRKRARPYQMPLHSKLLCVVFIMMPTVANSSVNYGYDALGRVTSALYDNGLCIAYAYDVNGNRTSQTNTIGGAPETPTWGTGSWDCFKWTP